MTRVAIKYCGNCDPWTDLARLGREIKSLLESYGMAVCDPYSDDLEGLVILNGCPRACADRPEVWQAARTHVTLSGVVIGGGMASGALPDALAERVLCALTER